MNSLLLQNTELSDSRNTETAKFSSTKQLVSIASFKGGVGKTTTAVHLSAYFQKMGKTFLVDGDPNRYALAWSERV